MGSALLSLLGVVLQDTTAKLGLGCSPISAVGVGSGSACHTEAVCCQNNNVVSEPNSAIRHQRLTKCMYHVGRSRLDWLSAGLPLGGDLGPGWMMSSFCSHVCYAV